MSDYFTFALAAFLTFSSGFFSSSETALFSLPGTKVRAYKHSKDSAKRLIAILLDRPQDLLVTIFILNTIVNILLQNAVSEYVGESGGWLLKVGLPFILLLFFGEILPKQIGLEKNEWLSHFVAPIISFSQKIFKPLCRITIAITEPISRFGFFFLKKDEELTPDELKHALKKSQEFGVLHPAEVELADGYLEMRESSVKEIMRPKEEIIAYNLKEPLTKLTHFFVDQECTRLPVYQETLDDVVGIIDARTYFVHRDEIKEQKDLAGFMKKPFYSPETAPAKVLLKQMDEQGVLLSLVVNEYGVITGLITKEDLLELVVGAITDRRDSTEYYTTINSDAIIAVGKMEIEDLEELFEVELESITHALTLGGWLTEKLGDIPKVGAVYISHGLEFKVLAADPSRVKKVYISKVKV